ncbi:hypothetical protein HPB50_019382 [Hyalomma asiaticum]|uniref:Uncharacterized protein n=1 Tax=Hyalomma asiaticum TaxID=266040 RepID=A0ACB7SJS1_HYAAI|nr:hypothetical protein HPB50_019382 [Hyalomma asiaticum]
MASRPLFAAIITVRVPWATKGVAGCLSIIVFNLAVASFPTLRIRVYLVHILRNGKYRSPALTGESVDPKVNCWFCGVQTVVPYGNINCWDCPSCEQYNGFKSDGDYNKPIPAQFDEALNFATASSCQADSSPAALKLKPDNQLCSICNYHQVIKLRLLTNFTPTEESRFETEVEQYRKHLDEVYALCQPCEAQVKRTLTLQDSLLRPHLVGRTPPGHWKVLAHYCLPWKQRLRLLLSVAASAMSISASTMLLLALLEGNAVLTQYYSKLGLADVAASMLSLRLLQPAGFVLAGSSVLLAGRPRLGFAALHLCLCWLLMLLSSHTEMENWLGYGALAWCQLVLTTSTVVLGVIHTVNLVKSYLRGGALRKLVSPSGSSLSSSPCTSSTDSLSSSAYLPNWEGSQCNGRSQFGFGDNHSTCSWKTKVATSDLSDRMTDVHISPESERSWATSTWSKPTSLQGISQEPASASCMNLADMSGGSDGRPRSLLRPAKLLFEKGSSWMTGGVWAMGGTRTPSNTKVLWGVRQSFGVLTPPPSLAGSTKDSSGSGASATGCKQKKADWCFFKQKDAFFSSSPDDTLTPEMRTQTSAKTPETKMASIRHRSLPDGHRIHGGSTARHRSGVSRETASSPVLNTQGRGYAKSSVSETSLATGMVPSCEAATPEASSSMHQARRPFPTLAWFLLGLSVMLNVALFFYYTFRSRVAVVAP